jgi:hypothetical protein
MQSSLEAVYSWTTADPSATPGVSEWEYTRCPNSHAGSIGVAVHHDAAAVLRMYISCLATCQCDKPGRLLLAYASTGQGSA